MYYSKNNFTNISVPKNYSGNAFKVMDETEKRQVEKLHTEAEKTTEDFSTKIEEKHEEKAPKSDLQPSFFNSFLSDFSVEDLLLLGLIFVIHHENPNDSILLLLLLLLLAK